MKSRNINIPLTFLTVSLLIFSSTASSQFMPITDKSTIDLLMQEERNSYDARQADSQHCADPNQPGSLGEKQKSAMDERLEIVFKSLDLDKVFIQAEDAGCFTTLSKFPDLSATIPSLTGIVESVTKGLIEHATREVCEAVNVASKEVTEPINKMMEKMSARGQIDLSGKVNKEFAKQLYTLESSAGKLENKPKQIIKFNW